MTLCIVPGALYVARLFVQFLERCTTSLDLPFAARRLFDETGKEHFSLVNVSRDQLVYVSCGETWSDPTLSKAEQQRRFLLNNLASDVSQIRHYVSLRRADGTSLRQSASCRRLVTTSSCVVQTVCHYVSLRCAHGMSLRQPTACRRYAIMSACVVKAVSHYVSLRHEGGFPFSTTLWPTLSNTCVVLVLYHFYIRFGASSV